MKDALTPLEPLNQLDGFVCDIETGICGPVSMTDEEKTEEEKKNANNDMV